MTIDESAVVAGLEALRETAPGALLPRILKATGLADEYVTRKTELGTVYIAFGDNGVTACVPAANHEEFARIYRRRFGRSALAADDPPARLVATIDRALATGRPGRLRIDWTAVTDFQAAVLRKTSEILPGEVRPYSWVAREIGRPGAVRAVGTALATNPVPVLIPCHRVVKADGSVGNYAFGSDAKRNLLASEGLDVETYETEVRSGIRFAGSHTTGIYCHPTCRDARRISSRHRVTFRSAAEAAEAGYRPCSHCRPEALAA